MSPEKSSEVKAEMMRVTKTTKCRACGNQALAPVLDLGAQYLSSIFPTDLNYRQKLSTYPLDLVLCEIKDKTKHCGLLQLGHEINLDSMYEAYPYTSSSNSSMKKILENVVASGISLNHLNWGDLVLDIGCNDGTLLSFFRDKNLDLLGIDAAQNIKPIEEAKDIPTLRTFFNQKSFESATSKKAKLIFSIAMFYHLHDPMTFSRDVAACLAQDGVWIVQMAYLGAMLETNMYDNIVHEHAGYYGIETMEWMMQQIGLEVFDVELNDVYGGSYRLFIKKQSNKKLEKTKRYHELLEAERKCGILELATYRAFAARVEKTKKDLIELVARLNKEGAKIWIYGASTKGNTIMQYCGLSARDIPATADSNPFKFGKYIIGCDIPIFDENKMRAAKPDYLLALPYSFVEGFMEREAALVKGGTKFIVPLPNVKILPEGDR